MAGNCEECDCSNIADRTYAAQGGFNSLGVSGEGWKTEAVKGISDSHIGCAADAEVSASESAALTSRVDTRDIVPSRASPSEDDRGPIGFTTCVLYKDRFRSLGEHTLDKRRGSGDIATCINIPCRAAQVPVQSEPADSPTSPA